MNQPAYEAGLPPVTSGLRVLIVDDEEQVTDSIIRYLRAEGYDVQGTYSAGEALERMSRRPADVVLTDIRMPKVNGLELLSRLRESFPRADVVLFSAHGQMEDAIQALRRGAYDYLQKPVDFEELVLLLERIAEKRRNEEQLRAVQDQLYHAQKMESLGALAGGVAHEFNNLMGGIVGYADMALHSEDGNLHRKALEMGMKAASRGVDIARKLLRFARREKHSRQPTDLNEVLHDTLSLLETELRNEEIQLETEFAEVPVVEIDAAQFQQVILNLVINARQAILEKAVVTPRRIVVRTWAEGDRVWAQVEDTGTGIPEAVQSRVFEPFFTTRGVLGGGDMPGATGLGLAVADGIVRGHKGTFKVESVPGEGATFTFSIPRSVVAEGPRHRILVVDDEQSVRRIMRSVLERAGFLIDEAPNGREALARLEETDYGLILLDQLMPGMSGLDVLHAVQTRGLGVPVVMVTALTNHELARQAVVAGARECVFKPVNNPKLLFLANKYCATRESLIAPHPPSRMVSPHEKEILVVDDDPVVRDIYALVLGREGFRLSAVGTAREALDRTENTYYDLILMDLRMPDMIGPSTIQALRVNNPYTPIMISTSHPSDTAVQEGLRAGASRVIEKPIDADALLKEVHSLISLYQDGTAAAGHAE